MAQENVYNGPEIDDILGRKMVRCLPPRVCGRHNIPAVPQTQCEMGINPVFRGRYTDHEVHRNTPHNSPSFATADTKSQ